ncbi:MAG TPA: hypothetical protein DEV73_01835 [Candidatus Zambryskibacteria bacterium]|uniref:Uncharacterized protein n=1 Tax=Candidatus Collierbacteria bacterium GW2011_GWC2_43_12 TaxID=1618390 RepID=A0A0G1D3V6_9BACT|nr:MAG: hypothetical protein UV68_C0046G0008 [Candidatus Collierbacteria bacterium GW2011_GWC2_43_12]HCH59338.1 hypothetical protein [Candidatus Zambryskibacteria bacterium]
MRFEEIEKAAQFGRQETEATGQKVIALEGPVCAGKSTLLERLGKLGAQTVDEYSEYVLSATKDFPKFPPRNEEESRASFMFFFDLEIARKMDRDLLITPGQVLLDRSIYTLMAFEVGAARITGIDILPWAVEYLRDKGNKIIQPDHIIYLDTTVSVSRERANQGKIRIAPFMLTEEFNEGFRSFFLELKKINPNLVTIMDGTKSEDTLQLDIEELLGSKDLF